MFRFNLQDMVQLAPGGEAYEIRWRGTVWTAGGEILTVYWIGRGAWDCYYDDELLPAEPGARLPEHAWNQKDSVEGRTYYSNW